MHADHQKKKKKKGRPTAAPLSPPAPPPAVPRHVVELHVAQGMGVWALDNRGHVWLLQMGVDPEIWTWESMPALPA